ncbi:hypothetical protein Psi01_59300 [Planobispora siamensis]|uniref:Uncharacterized protein n=1 Tax=Planobispora siamensis TaxID=936338 RepID=A0A8J3WN24_9ACTN|nr:hypothetical protein Psi01_59300 [Planobispora siamensis]
MAKKSRHHWDPDPTVEPLPAHISNPCRRGDHDTCLGRVALYPVVDGKRFTRCECPVCNHPAIRTIRVKSSS